MMDDNTIIFSPVCGHCHNVINEKIEYSETFNGLGGEKPPIFKEYHIKPYECPYCKTKFNQIIIPGKFPIDHRFVRTNLQWLSTLRPEQVWAIWDWLLNNYEKNSVNTRSAVIDWLEKEHMDCLGGGAMKEE